MRSPLNAISLAGLIVKATSNPIYSVELGDDSPGNKCSCCGRFTRRINGFVSLDGNAHAAYIALWTEGHREFGVSMVISIGGWGGGSVEERYAVAVDWSVFPTGPALTVQDAASSRWAADASTLGRMLSREEVLHTQAGEEAFRVSDAIFDQDSRFHDFWYTTPQ